MYSYKYKKLAAFKVRKKLNNSKVKDDQRNAFSRALTVCRQIDSVTIDNDKKIKFKIKQKTEQRLSKSVCNTK